MKNNFEQGGIVPLSAKKSSNPISLRVCSGKCFEARKRSDLTKVGGANLKVGGTVVLPPINETPHVPNPRKRLPVTTGPQLSTHSADARGSECCPTGKALREECTAGADLTSHIQSDVPGGGQLSEQQVHQVRSQVLHAADVEQGQRRTADHQTAGQTRVRGGAEVGQRRVRGSGVATGGS